MMIMRDPQTAATGQYDLVVIGGGIHGACLALASAWRGLRPLLIEKGDFGEATSYSTLRILHGGLRYLQKADLVRFFRSVAERRWFVENFSDLVRPLSCMMPLYGNGVYRPEVLRGALLLNDVLSWRRNHGLAPSSCLPGGRVLDKEETIRYFPLVDPAQLRGAALWHDGVMRSPQRIVIEILKWACDLGAVVLNYTEATGLMIAKGRAIGVEAIDCETEQALCFRAPVIANCAGPWCRSLAEKLDRDVPQLFHPSLAFNLLLDRPPLSEHAIAVAPRRSGARMYFLLPLGRRVLAGTYHTACTQPTTCAEPTRDQVESLLSGLNKSIPGFNTEYSQVVRIDAGVLPATSAGSARQANRDILYDHGSHRGPRGVFSVSGVKFTTAPAVAETVLRTLYGKRCNGPRPRRTTGNALGNDQPDWWESTALKGTNKLRMRVKRLTQEEAVVHLDDLLFRRTSWGERWENTSSVLEALAECMCWDTSRRAAELKRLGPEGSCGPVGHIPPCDAQCPHPSVSVGLRLQTEHDAVSSAEP